MKATKKIRIPKMLLLDYGQTLVDETSFNGIAGMSAIMKYAIENKYHRTPEQVQEEAEVINGEIGRFSASGAQLLQIEIPNNIFVAYLYESLGIRLSIPYSEIDTIFWDAASPGRATKGVAEFLEFLRQKHIRTGVISNIPYSGQAVERRIRETVPGHTFEFIITSSEYCFRKPNKRIFQLALEKAGLQAEDVWYIGDNYECDVVGARKAGIFPVWFIGAVKQYEAREDVLTVSQWSELQKLLEGGADSNENI